MEKELGFHPWAKAESFVSCFHWTDEPRKRRDNRCVQLLSCQSPLPINHEMLQTDDLPTTVQIWVRVQFLIYFALNLKLLFLPNSGPSSLNLFQNIVFLRKVNKHVPSLLTCSSTKSYSDASWSKDYPWPLWQYSATNLLWFDHDKVLQWPQ